MADARIGRGFVGRPGRTGQTESDPEPNPPPPGVMSRANFEYLGCIGLFQGSDASGMKFSEGGASMRIRPSDGKLVFFITREKNPGIPGEYAIIYEVEDPGIAAYQPFYALAARTENAPVAKTVGSVRGLPYDGAYMKSWFSPQGPIPEGFSLGDRRYPSGGGFLLGALMWNEAEQLLYSTYYDFYNTQGYADWGLIATDIGTLNESTHTYEGWTTYGPWRIKCTDADGASYYGPHRAIGLAIHPTTGKMLVSSSMLAGNVACTWGPSLYGGADWPTASTPSGYGNPDITQPNRWLNHYYMGGAIDENGAYTPPLRSFRRRTQPYIWETVPRNPVINVNPGLYSGVGSWGDSDASNIGAWLELTNTKGVIFFATLAGATSQDPTNRDAGHEWYQVNDQPCSHGHQPYLHNQGPVSTHSFPAMIIYNPDDLEAVKNTSNDYTPEPVDVINLEDVFNMRTPNMDTPGWKNCGFVGYNPATKIMYVLSLYADDQYAPAGGGGALMHAFQVIDEETP